MESLFPVVDVIMTNSHTKEVTEMCFVCRTDIITKHKEVSKEHPDCHVNFLWSNRENFILGMPYNQELDEEKVDRGDMTFDDYRTKWYGY